MTAQPIPRPALPSQVHRVACDRAIRLAHHQGVTEVLAFYDEMTPGERRITFALLARLAGRRHIEALPGDEDSPWWTPAELRLAHSLWNGGHRSAWINAGHKLYIRDQARVARDARRGRPAQAEVGGRPRVRT